MEVIGILLLVAAFFVVLHLWKADNKLRQDAMAAIKKTQESKGEPETPKPGYQPQLDPDIAFLRQRIKPLPPFAMGRETVGSLKADPFDPQAISRLVGEIIRHLRMVVLSVHVSVLPDQAPAVNFVLMGADGLPQQVGETQDTYTAGRYVPKAPFTFEIQIQMKNHYDFANVVAITCHEVVHHYLREKDIKRADAAANERLTDVAAIYLGMGHQLLFGYRPRETKTQYGHVQGKTVTHTVQHTLGYIKHTEINGLMRMTEEVRRQMEREERESDILRAVQASERQGAEQMLETAEMLVRFNEGLLDRMMEEKTALDADTLSKVQATVVSKERDEYRAVIEKARALLNGASFAKDADAMVRLDSLCRELSVNNTAFQAALGNR